jgi:ABC-type antimicrobial peptide transport system permease subunit
MTGDRVAAGDTPSGRADQTALGVSVAPLTPELASRYRLPRGTRGLVVENVFGIPGLGREFINTILARDYNMTIAIFTMYALLIGMVNAYRRVVSDHRSADQL